jgi:hypothetical protein
MIGEHEIYAGYIILETIKNELKGSKYTWYKQSRIKLEDETYKEKVYFLTDCFLVETVTTAEKFVLHKFARNTIAGVKKEFIYKDERAILVRAVVVFKNGSDLCFERPKFDEDGDTRGFVKFFELL